MGYANSAALAVACATARLCMRLPFLEREHEQRQHFLHTSRARGEQPNPLHHPIARHAGATARPRLSWAHVPNVGPCAIVVGPNDLLQGRP